MQVPLLDLRMQYAPLEAEILDMLRELCASQLFILGRRVEEFESQLAAYCGTPAAVGVSSGSDALLASLMAEGVGAGDEVITSPFTFFATAGAIARTGAKPVFADIDPVTFNIDPEKIEEKITPRTRAIIPVHLFGQAADMDKITAIAKKHGLFIIEDACQAIGAEYRGRRVGSFGAYGAFSFFPSKNLGCFGDGGAVSCGSEERAKRLKIFRNHGQSSTYLHEYVGGNFRLDALQAAVLSIKLRKLDDWSEARRRNAAEYREMFAASGIGNLVELPQEASYPVRHIYNQFCIRVKGGRRDALRDYLHAENVGCAVYYPLSLHLQPCFKELGGRVGDFPVSEAATQEVLALPIYGECSRGQRAFVVEKIAEFLKR